MLRLGMIVLLCVGAGSWVGCENGTHSDQAQAQADDAATLDAPPVTPAGSAEAARVELADDPDIDLVDNRFLWHLSPGTRPQGLMMALAGEGLRKYTQEYKQPWGAVREIDGAAGRALTARSAELRFPWSDSGRATVRVRVHGAVKGQRLSVDINGKRVANSALGAEWQVIDLAVDAGLLRAGENEMVLFLSKRGGPAKSYGLFHSIDIIPGELPANAAAPTAAWPALSPAAKVDIGGVTKPALRGFARMTMWLEIPRSGWLSVATGAAGGPAKFTVSAHLDDGSDKVLLQHEAQGGAWQPHQVSLAGVEGRLVALEFAVAGSGAAKAAWGAPRIALARTASRTRPKPYKNAIMLVVDAMRADRLTLYGKTRVKTPNITADGRARGVTFLYNQAASPSSPPSHGSIQTGMIPRVHGVDGDKGQLTPGTPMISTQLGDGGIATGYYGNNPFGMARLQKPGKWTEFHQPNQEGKGIDCTVLMDEILSFAKGQAKGGKRFFVSSLPYETHTPYRYHEGISDHYHAGPWPKPVGQQVDGGLLSGLSSGKVKLNQAQWAQLHALYDGEAEYMDGCYKQLLDGLGAAGLREDTLIILTSDHGEGMFEHGRMGHAFGHFAELANVPLVLIGDGLSDTGISVATVTSHLDIVPTILDLMGVRPSERIQGQSLVPMAMRKGPWVPRVMPLEYGRSYALRAERWKYIVDYSGNESLFDSKNDPTEQHELAAKNPFALRYMRDVAGFFLAHRSQWRMATFGTLNNHRAGFLAHVNADKL
jgi:arylsulfatase A-like enzyme